jgi:hypothetical protein
MLSDQAITASIEIAKEGGQITKPVSPSDVADLSLIKSIIREYEKKRP